MQPACLSSFSYAWFPNVNSTDQKNWLPGTFTGAGASSKTYQFFRLPAMDINRRTEICTPSPFINGTIYRNGENRSYTAKWSSIIPSGCGNDLTQHIVQIVGPGPYTIDPHRNTTATLSMADDNNTITCGYHLSADQSNFTIIAVNVTGR